jgi:hypothetical protein
MIFKKMLIFVAVFSFTILPLVGTFALAEDGNDTGPGQPKEIKFDLINPIKADNLIELLNLVVDAAMLVLIPLIVLAIIYTGFLFIKARGVEKDITAAKQMFYYVIIGAAIILASKLIITFVSSTIGSLKP